MNKRKLGKIALVLLLVALLYLIGFPLFKAEQKKGVRNLTNRVWVDRMPRSQRDLVNQLILVGAGKYTTGAAGVASRWRVWVDLLRYRVDGNLLHLEFPQESIEMELKARTWACPGEAPKPFDLCLELTLEDGRSVVFYSRKDWKFWRKGGADAAEVPEPLRVRMERLLTGAQLEPDQDVGASAEGEKLVSGVSAWFEGLSISTDH